MFLNSKSLFKAVWVSTFLVAGSLPAWAASAPVKILSVSSRATNPIQRAGCGPGKYNVTLAPDQSAVSVLFDEFIAEAGGNTGRQDQRTTCFLDMQIQALPGYRIAVSQADIRGFYSLKNRAYLQAAFYFETNGFRSPTVNRRIVGPKDESNWVPPIGLRVSDYRWSACGGTASINFAASMIVVSNSAREQTLAQLDSSDFSTNFQIVAQPCP